MRSLEFLFEGNHEKKKARESLENFLKESLKVFGRSLLNKYLEGLSVFVKEISEEILAEICWWISKIIIEKKIGGISEFKKFGISSVSIFEEKKWSWAILENSMETFSEKNRSSWKNYKRIREEMWKELLQNYEFLGGRKEGGSMSGGVVRICWWNVGKNHGRIIVNIPLRVAEWICREVLGRILENFERILRRNTGRILKKSRQKSLEFHLEGTFQKFSKESLKEFIEKSLKSSRANSSRNQSKIFWKFF